MSSLRPFGFANRPLAIEQPPFQAGPPNSSNIGHGATAYRAPNQFNQYNEDIEEHITTAIHELLKNLDNKAAKSEATQSNAFAIIHKKLLDLDRCWDVVIDRKNPGCLSAVFDPLFDLRPAMAENQKVLLDTMNTFHSALMRQQGKLFGKVARMELGQLQTREDMENMQDVQSYSTERLKHVHQVNLGQHEILRARLEEFDDERKELENTLMGKLDIVDCKLEKQERNLMEQMTFMDENQSDLQNSLMEGLEQIDTNLEDQKINLMEKMNDASVEQSGLENKVMELLNKLQEQQKKAESSHSQLSVLVYASQDRIIDHLDVLERKICQMLEKIPNVSEAGGSSEEQVLTVLREDIAQFGPEEHDAEVFVAPIDLPIDQPAELDAGGTLKALWEFLAPLLVVSMFLSLW